MLEELRLAPDIERTYTVTITLPDGASTTIEDEDLDNAVARAVGAVRFYEANGPITAHMSPTSRA